MSVMAVLATVVLLQAAQAAAPASPAMKAFEEATALFQKQENEKALEAYDRAIALDATNPEFHIGRGRTLQRLRRFDEAFGAYGAALKLAPDHAMALRYRGHASINVRRLDEALADLTRAEALKKDEYNIYYHLALAHYLKGQFAEAAKWYEGCVRTSKTDDERIACTAWQYPALVRAKRDAEAKKVLDAVSPLLVVQDNQAYLDRLLLFKGVRTESELAATMEASPLQKSTVGYGIGLWHLLAGREDKAREYFQKAVSTDYWPAFGFVAAEVELQRMK